MCINNTPIYLRIIIIISGPIAIGMIDYMLFKYTCITKLRPVIIAISGVIGVFWLYYWATIEFLSRGC